MVDALPPQIAAQQAILQQNVSMSLIKSANKADQMIANVLADSADHIAASSRGNHVNFTA